MTKAEIIERLQFLREWRETALEEVIAEIDAETSILEGELVEEEVTQVFLDECAG